MDCIGGEQAKHIGGCCLKEVPLEAPQRERKIRVYRAEFDEERWGHRHGTPFCPGIIAEFPPLFAYEKANAPVSSCASYGKTHVSGTAVVLQPLSAFCESISGSHSGNKRKHLRVSLNVDVACRRNELYEAQPLLWAAFPDVAMSRKEITSIKLGMYDEGKEGEKIAEERDPLERNWRRKMSSPELDEEDNKLDDGNSGAYSSPSSTGRHKLSRHFFTRRTPDTGEIAITTGGIPMLKVGVIGIGQCGSRQAQEFKRIHSAVDPNIVALALNSSKTDLSLLDESLIPSKHRIAIADGGSGRNPGVGRKLMQKALDSAIEYVRRDLGSSEIIYIFAGAGGGTGNGGAPILGGAISEALHIPVVYM